MRKSWTLGAVMALALLTAAVGRVGAAEAMDGKAGVAIFAGGCFWCVESDFDKVPGVTETISGYIGGSVDKPTYKQVTAGGTGHREAVRIRFDPKVVSYETLLDVFWHSVDPTDGGGQFCDRGFSYSTAVYAVGDEQLQQAEASKAAIEESGALEQPIATEIVAAGEFFPAEGYHQNYYERNPVRYNLYRLSCGRDARVKALWGGDAFMGMTKKHGS